MSKIKELLFAAIEKVCGELEGGADEAAKLPLIKAVDELQREVVFIVYEPYTLDAHNEWAAPETIRKACENFNQNLASGGVVPNLFHLAPTETFTIVKSWVNECDCLVGDQYVGEGAWLVKIKIVSDDLWAAFMDGTVSGVSIGAKGAIIQPEED